MGLLAEQESLPKAQAIGGWVVVEAKQRIHPSPARGAVGKPRKPKGIQATVRYSCFFSRVGALAFPTAGFLFCFDICAERVAGIHLSGNGNADFLKFREQSVFLKRESARVLGERVVFVRWSAVSCRTRYVGGGCRARDDYSFYTIGFFDDDKATVRVLFRRTRTEMVIAFRA
jgi:hypothetical protein